LEREAIRDEMGIALLNPSYNLFTRVRTLIFLLSFHEILLWREDK